MRDRERSEVRESPEDPRCCVWCLGPAGGPKYGCQRTCDACMDRWEREYRATGKQPKIGDWWPERMRRPA